MAFTKLTKSVLNITALPDRVENQAQVLKATFDQAGVDIKEAHNALIDELELNSSASNIGARNSQLGNSTVQTELDLLNTKLSNKVDKASGKQLSTEDYTTAEKIKLANISEGANNYELPEASTTTLGGIKVDGSTIVVENGVAKAKAADAADYTARAEIEKLANNVLTKDNTTEYMPTEDYHPVPKKYVDDLETVTEVKAEDIVVGTFAEGMKCATPTEDEHITNKGYVDAGLATKATITYGTTDLTAGTSELATGTIYFVYE